MELRVPTQLKAEIKLAKTFNKLTQVTGVFQLVLYMQILCETVYHISN